MAMMEPQGPLVEWVPPVHVASLVCLVSLE